MSTRGITSTISRSLDLLGMIALGVTALLLGGSFWFMDEFLKGILLSGVFPWLLTSTALFGLARIVDLAGFALSQSHPSAAEPEEVYGADANAERTVPGLRIVPGGKDGAASQSRIDNAA